jgi:hypothetical protein
VEKKRKEAFMPFMSGMVKNLSRENRKRGGDDNVSGVVIG